MSQGGRKRLAPVDGVDLRLSRMNWRDRSFLSLERERERLNELPLRR